MSVKSFLPSDCANASLGMARTEHPWERIHIDYAGPFMGKMFLLVIDAHSRWIEVETVNTASTQNTIEHLRSMFSKFGLPQVIVTDNGTCFTSYEFKGVC